MVAKLLLAVQERVFEARELGAPERQALCGFYRRGRDGLGYRKSVAAHGAFPADPYSHTPGEGGAQPPVARHERVGRLARFGLGRTQSAPDGITQATARKRPRHRS